MKYIPDWNIEDHCVGTAPRNKPPNGWRSVTLSKLLTREQVKCVVLIATENTDPILRVRRLKAYLEPLAAELEAKGVDSNFLAYAIEHYIEQHTHDSKAHL